MSNVELIYSPANLADAIADLCKPTGNERLDILNEAIIGLLQEKLLKAVHVNGDTTVFRYAPTDKGIRIVRNILGDGKGDTRYP